MKTENVIQLRGVRKTYRKGGQEVTPLHDVSLDIASGEFFALMGPSGSGKSTLLNLIAGIDKATAGRVVVHGEDITDWSEDDLASWRTRAVGYVFQQFNLMPVLTAYENVELPLLLLPLNSAKRRSLVTAALALVGLEDRAHHFPRQLSGGQEQRVAIARSIASDPLVLLADEPTGNLDRESAESVMQLFRDLNEKFGKTIVMVTHDPHVSSFAKRVMHLDKGDLLEAMSNVQSPESRVKSALAASLSKAVASGDGEQRASTTLDAGPRTLDKEVNAEMPQLAQPGVST